MSKNNKFIIIAAITGLILTPVIFLSYRIFLVFQAARKVAGITPYCIQVHSKSGNFYRGATNLLDLSPITMQVNSRSKQILHHAILVLGQKPSQLYYWSYKNNQFEPGNLTLMTGYTPAIYCQPKKYFVSNLLFPKLDKPANDDKLYVSYGKKEFLIPKVYHPKGSWHGFIKIYLSPSFQTIKKPISSNEEINIAIGKNELHLRKKQIQQIQKIISVKSVERLESEYGLNKIAIKNKNNNLDRVIYYALNNQTELTTTISCYPKFCSHTFIKNDISITLTHSPQSLPQWQKIQSHLTNLIDSFTINTNS